MCQGLISFCWGYGHPILNGEALYTHDWVYDHPLAQGTNRSLDSSTCGQPNEFTKHVLAESFRIAFWLAPFL